MVNMPKICYCVTLPDYTIDLNSLIERYKKKNEGWGQLFLESMRKKTPTEVLCRLQNYVTDLFIF